MAEPALDDLLADLDEYDDVSDLDTEALYVGAPRDQATIAVVVKRTYDTAHGRCRLADEQLPLFDDELFHEEVQPPKVSSLFTAGDRRAFVDETDIIVQGHAHAHAYVPKTVVALEVCSMRRSIVVFGDRYGDFRAGQPCFSPPQPFERIALRYENAYGGVDAHALEERGYLGREAAVFTRPEWRPDCDTPFHYPRNPAGRGYLMDLSRPAFEGLRLPNLEEAGDPLNPQRLAVGSPERWLHAPLPAAWDWLSPLWFPRAAYIGYAPYAAPLNGPCAEVERGWASPDLMAIAPLLRSETAMRQEFAQAASPGLSLRDVPSSVAFKLERLHPHHAEWHIALPGEHPEVQFRFDGLQRHAASPHIASITLLPDEDRIVVVWSCRLALSPAQAMAEPHYELTWRSS